MKKNNLIIFYLPLLFTTLLFSCSKPITGILWQYKPVKADGILKEWEIPLRYFDEKSKLQYTITNDSAKLYVAIRATDELSQMKIIRAGMQFWIDSTGKKKQGTGLLFPLASNANSGLGTDFTQGDSIKPKMHQFRKPDVKMLKARFEKELQQMQLLGYKAPVGGTTLLKNDYGIAANLDWDSTGNMNYEAIIPFKTFYKNYLALADSQKVFTVTIVVPGLPSPALSGGENGHASGVDMTGAGGVGLRGSNTYGNKDNSAGWEGESNEGTGAYSDMYVTNTIVMRIRFNTKEISN